MATFSMIVHKPGTVCRLGGQYVTMGAGEHVVATGKTLAEASAWARRSPRFRSVREESAK